LLKFRHLLQHNDLTRALFNEINAHHQVLALVVMSPRGRVAGRRSRQPVHSSLGAT